MARRSVAPPADPADDPALAAEIENLEKQDFWQRHASLSEEEKKVSTIYVYRLDPPIAKEGEDNYIDRIPSHLFERDLLISKHGGGKFQLYHNSKLEGLKFNFKRIVAIPGIPAKIYPTHILVDERGAALPTAAAGAPPGPGTPQPPATKDDIRSIIQETAAAAGAGMNATQDALKAGISLVTTGATEALKIVANAKGSGDSAGVESLRAELAALRSELQNREKQVLQDQITELRAKLDAPAKRGEMGAVSETATLLGVDGGVMGLLKQVLGTGAKEDVWEYGGKKIADAIGSFITENGPSLTAWLRERTHVQHLEVLTKRQQSGLSDVPPPPAAPIHRPVPPPRTLQPEQEPQGEETAPGQITGDEMFEMLKQEIPKTIRYYWDRNFDGGATAEIVKGNFKPWLPLLRLQFNDLTKVIELAKADPQLAPITADPEFPEWAKEFFEEFHRAEPDESPAPAAG